VVVVLVVLLVVLQLSDMRVCYLLYVLYSLVQALIWPRRKLPPYNKILSRKIYSVNQGFDSIIAYSRLILEDLASLETFQHRPGFAYSLGCDRLLQLAYIIFTFFCHIVTFKSDGTPQDFQELSKVSVLLIAIGYLRVF
jgi:hypothetical protein